MKTKKLIMMICVAMATTSFVAKSQDKVNPDFSSPAINTTSYSTAIGLRAGETSGLTIKQFIGSQTALEGILGIWPNALSGTILFEKYSATGVNGLNWYYGAGGHAAFQTTKIYYYPDRYYYYRRGDVGLGIDGILGIEYKIPPIPFAISLDVKPYIEANTAGGIYTLLDPGLGIKVTF